MKLFLDEFFFAIWMKVYLTAHTLQALCQADLELTLTSLDGVSTFDLISRRALEGIAHVPGGALFLRSSVLRTVMLVGRRPRGGTCDRTRRRW